MNCSGESGADPRSDAASAKPRSDVLRHTERAVMPCTISSLRSNSSSTVPRLGNGRGPTSRQAEYHVSSKRHRARPAARVARVPSGVRNSRGPGGRGRAVGCRRRRDEVRAGARFRSSREIRASPVQFARRQCNSRVASAIRAPSPSVHSSGLRTGSRPDSAVDTCWRSRP